VTLGPKGQYAVLHNPLVAPTVINEGVTIAEELYLEVLFEN
jgi:chaperonin GroEL (HSP60 family)